MTTSTLGMLTAVTATGAVLALIAGLRRRDPEPDRRPLWHGWPWRRLATAGAAGLITLLITGWVAVAVAVVALAGWWPKLFGGGREHRRAVAQLEALAAWTESLRDIVATGAGLAEALPASIPAAASTLTPALSALVERMRARAPMEQALRAFADDLDDVSADLVVAALLLNARTQGRQLHAVLSALASSTRAELAMRRAVDADRRATRRGVQIVLAVTVVMALALRLFNPSYVSPYRTATGQLVLAVVVAIFAFGFAWLHRLAQLPAPARFLDRDQRVSHESVRVPS